MSRLKKKKHLLFETKWINNKGKIFLVDLESTEFSWPLIDRPLPLFSSRSNLWKNQLNEMKRINKLKVLKSQKLALVDTLGQDQSYRYRLLWMNKMYWEWQIIYNLFIVKYVCPNLEVYDMNLAKNVCYRLKKKGEKIV